MQVICLLSHLSSCTRCVFLLILGEQRSYFVHLYQIQKSLISAQIMGSFSSFDKTLLCLYHNIFYSCGLKDHVIVCSIWYLLIASFYFVCLCAIRSFFLQSLGPQYSLFSSNYLSLYLCISLHSFAEKYTLFGGPPTILAF